MGENESHRFAITLQDPDRADAINNGLYMANRKIEAYHNAQVDMIDFI